MSKIQIIRAVFGFHITCQLHGNTNVCNGGNTRLNSITEEPEILSGI